MHGRHPGSTRVCTPLRPSGEAEHQRYEKIFDTYESFDTGPVLLLVDDRGPNPPRCQFEAEHADELTWDYIESVPKVWRVRTGRLGREHLEGLPSAQRC